MTPPTERARRQRSLMKDAVRLCGMRGDTNREIQGFPGIVARHASRIDHAAYLLLMTDPNPDWLAVRDALAALARRSPGFQEEFDAAEARRFEMHDRADLMAFEEKIQAIVAKAESVRVPQFQLRQLDALHGLAASIPDNEAGFGPRWRKEGEVALTAAVAHIEALMARDTAPSRLDEIEASTRRTEQTMAGIAPSLKGVPRMLQWASDASHTPMQAADELRRMVNLTPEEAIVREAFLKHGEGRRVARELGISPSTVSRRRKAIIAKFEALGIPGDSIFNQRPSLEAQRLPDGDAEDPSSDWRQDFDGRIRTIRSYLASTPEGQAQYRDRYQDIAAEADKYERMKFGVKSRATRKSPAAQ